MNNSTQELTESYPALRNRKVLSNTEEADVIRVEKIKTHDEVSDFSFLNDSTKVMDETRKEVNNSSNKIGVFFTPDKCDLIMVNTFDIPDVSEWENSQIKEFLRNNGCNAESMEDIVDKSVRADMKNQKLEFKTDSENNDLTIPASLISCIVYLSACLPLWLISISMIQETFIYIALFSFMMVPVLPLAYYYTKTRRNMKGGD